VVKVIKCLHKFAEVMQVKGLAPSIHREKEIPIKLSDFSQEEVLDSKREIADMIRTTMKKHNKPERLSIDEEFFDEDTHEITSDKSPKNTTVTPVTNVNSNNINNKNNNANSSDSPKMTTISETEEEAINALQKTLETSESEFKQDIRLRVQQAKNDVTTKIQSLKEMLEQVQTRVLEDINFREAEMLKQLTEIEKHGTPKNIDQFSFNPNTLLNTDPITELLVNLQVDWTKN